MNNKTVLGLMFVLVGVWIALKIVGISLGPIIGFLFPIILMGLGYIGIKNGSKLIGGILFAVGLIILLGKLSGLIFFALAIGLIVWGISMFRRNKRGY
jgi:predicted membrane protein